MDALFKAAVSTAHNYLYVPEDADELQLIYQKRDKIQKLEEDNIKFFAPEVSEYNKIIIKTAALIKEISFKNSTSEFITFTYLLWNGIFSKEGKYQYETKNLLDISKLYHFDIINGHGACRSNAELLKRVFTSLGYNVYFLVNTISLQSIDYSINNNIYTDNIILTGAKEYKPEEISKIGDHASILLEKDNNYYIYDATNKFIFKVDNGIRATLYNGKGTCYIKPWGFIVYESLNQKAVINLINKMRNQKTNKFLTDKEIQEITIDSLASCHKSKKLIRDCRNEIKPHIDNIANNLKI